MFLGNMKANQERCKCRAGKELNDDEVKTLKRARKDGNFQSALLDLRHKGKHDKHAY